MKPRLLELDGLRGMAILLVVFYHYVPCLIYHPEPGSLFAFIARAGSIGRCGVDLFFVLSGFLITGIYLDHGKASNFIGTFVARRALRILPVYMLLLASYYAFDAFVNPHTDRFQWLFQHPLSFLSYATFTQNIEMGLVQDWGGHWLGITWSLAVEEQFYLIFPLAAVLLGRTRLIQVSLFFAGLAVLLRSWLPGFHDYVNTPWRADSLLTGVILAVALRNAEFVSLVRNNLHYLHVALWVGVTGIMQIAWNSHIFGVLDHLWLAVLFGLMITLVLHDRECWLAKLCRAPVLGWFGMISYGLYMYHQAMNGLAHGCFADPLPTVNTLQGQGAAVFAFVASLGAAVFSYHVMERHFIALGRRFTFDMESNEPRPLGSVAASVV